MDKHGVTAKWSFWILIPATAFIMALSAPAELWFKPKLFQVTDGVNGEIFIIFDREISHDFSGGYAATIRDANGTIACPVANFDLPYRVSSTLPEPITLKWWMGHDECDHLPSGTYVLSTQWRVDAFGIFRKYTDEVADTFVVFGG